MRGLVMKKSLITGALITGAMFGALIAGSAMAADMPVKAPIMRAPPPPVFTWTGCYFGGGGGYGMWNQENFLESDPSGLPISATSTAGGRGWFGTVGLGCDYQVSSNFVIGALADWDFGDIKGQFNPAGTLIVGSESEKWAWAAGGRIGYVVTPTLLTYISGGYTEAHFDPVTFTGLVTGVGGAFNIPSHTYKGWFIGSGFDYAISFLPTGFFLRSEYRYSEYKADDLSILTAAGALTGSAIDSKKFVQTIRTELTYRFNWTH
jgi:outer membrane immunogenic protein